MTEETMNTTQRSNNTLWLLLALFIVPAIGAYLYFFYGDRPDSHSNGQLITPVIDIETLQLTDASGVLLTRDELTPKWRMFYLVKESCDTDCQTSLYNMRQINIALGKNQDRVQHVLIHLAEPDVNLKQLIATEHETTIRVYSQADNLLILADEKSATDNIQYIYLMDPLGNIMMKFPVELNPKLILKDINKLLKISRIG